METNEIKIRSIRADSESFEKFKIISEEFPNQAQALASLISVYEIEKSKAILTDRQTEIESFTAYVQKINEIYNHSLLLNHDAEIRIRVEFQKKLTSKDETIQELQSKIKKIEVSEQTSKTEKNNLQQENSKNKTRITELEKEVFSLQEEKMKSDNVIKSLTEVTTEYKVYAKENEVLKNNISNLEKQSAELIHKNENLLNKVKEITIENEKIIANQTINIEKINNSNEMQMKYLKEKLELEKDQEILKIEKMYNEKINKLHEENQTRVRELLKQIEVSNKNMKVKLAKKRIIEKKPKESKESQINKD